MRQTDSSSVMDPDPFPNFSYNQSQRPIVGRESLELHASYPRRSVHFRLSPLPNRKSTLNTTRYEFHARESSLHKDNITPKASSMASSGFVDDEGFDGPNIRSIGSLTEMRSSERSRLATCAPATHSAHRNSDHGNHVDEEDANPWNWPKLPSIVQSNGYTIHNSTNQAKEMLTQSQLESLRSFLVAPKPAIPKSVDQSKRRTSTPYVDNTQTKELSKTKKLSIAAECKAGDPWATQKAFSAREEQSRRPPASPPQEGKLVHGGDGDNNSLPIWGEPESRAQNLAVSQNNEEGKKKAGKKRNGAKQKKAALDQPLTTVPPQYGYADSNSSKRLPSGLEKHSPTYEEKITDWPMDPKSSPPLQPENPPTSHRPSSSRNSCAMHPEGWGGASVKRGSSRDANERDDSWSDDGNNEKAVWGVPEKLGKRKSGSKMSRFDESGKGASCKASSTKERQTAPSRRSTSGGKESRRSIHSFHIPETSQRLSNIAAGTVIWADPSTLTAVKTVQHAGNTIGFDITAPSHHSLSPLIASPNKSANIATSHHTASYGSTFHQDVSQRPVTHRPGRSSSRQHSTSGGIDAWNLDPIPEDLPFENQHSKYIQSQPKETNQWTASRTSERESRRRKQSQSPAKSDPNRASINSSYRPPAVEDDTTNWSGWQEPDWQKPSHPNDRTASQSSDRNHSPKQPTSHRSGSKYKNQTSSSPVDVWVKGKIPSEASQGTGYEPQQGARKRPGTHSKSRSQQWHG